ncbi:hypothetical protein ACGFZL_13795 [Streptomyces sp. NPDC048182]|uniref:hypothetical protein n=1 Tax=Streptomyces sp. NPDC048182 TaxID=3365507 RepID=UPI003723E8A8
MSDGFCFWYADRLEREGVERFLRSLATDGVHLAHPASRIVTVLTDGPESWGEQVAVERAELVRLLTLNSGSEVTFQLWLDEHTDMVTRFRPSADGELVVEFGLDGMRFEEQETAVRAITHVVHMDLVATRGVVVDRRGVTEDTDWDGVMRGAPVEIAVWPDVLAVRPEVAAGHPRLRSRQGVRQTPLVFFEHRPSS